MIIIDYTFICLMMFIDGEDLIQRCVIIGILLGFRKLSLQALRAVLERRIPFMFLSVLDFKSNLNDKESRVSE